MSNSATIQRHQTLSMNVIAFCRFLREQGFHLITSSDASDAIEALTLVGIDDQVIFRSVLRAVLARSPRELQDFDPLFDLFWRDQVRENPYPMPPSSEDPDQDRVTSKNKTVGRYFEREAKTPSFNQWMNQFQPQETESISTYSPDESQSPKNLGDLHTDESDEMIETVKRLAKTLVRQRSRQFTRSQLRRRLDFRRTIRQSLGGTGELVRLRYRRRRVKRLKLVIVCDVSQSMKLYCRFLLLFLQSFRSVYRRVETFVFSTMLKRVSECFKSGRYADALMRLSTEFPQYAGGTRIGACLDDLVVKHGSRYLDPQTVVIVVSDGWDTGEPERLEAAMAEIHRRAAKVIWLNPLIGSDDYEPTCRGMEAALPYVDVFAPIGNMNSLHELVRTLSMLNTNGRQR